MKRLQDDSGAILVFTVLLLVAMMGAGALALDAAVLYQEHRELQNGADAAALAIAQSCSAGNTLADCNGGAANPDVHAEYYADLNAEDAKTDVAVDLSSWASNTVVVTTTTVQDGQNAGETGFFLAPVLGIDTGTTTATSTARWGAPVMGSLGTLPLVISACEYEKFVGSGGGDGTEPWDEATNGPMQWLKFHDGQAEDCAAQAGQDTDGDGRLPGGFGWIDTDSVCAAELQEVADGDDPGDDPDWEVPADPGASPDQNDCPPSYVESQLLGKVVYVPVFTDVNGLGGNNGVYTVSYYAAFYIAGYNFGGQYKEPPGFSCPGGSNERCIGGWFTTADAGSGQVGDGADTGVRVYGLSG